MTLDDSIEVTIQVFADGYAGYVAWTEEAPDVFGRGLSRHEASDDMAEQFNEIVWH